MENNNVMENVVETTVEAIAENVPAEEIAKVITLNSNQGIAILIGTFATGAVVGCVVKGIVNKKAAKAQEETEEVEAKKPGFFKRLFGKKSKSEPTVEIVENFEETEE